MPGEAGSSSDPMPPPPPLSACSSSDAYENSGGDGAWRVLEKQKGHQMRKLQYAMRFSGTEREREARRLEVTRRVMAEFARQADLASKVADARRRWEKAQGVVNALERARRTPPDFMLQTAANAWLAPELTRG